MLSVDFHVNYHSPGCSQTSSASSAAAAVNMTSAMTTTPAMLVTSAVGEGTTLVVGGRGVCGVVSALAGSTECRRESSLLFLLLVLGTVWLGLSLYNFTKTSVKLRVFAARCYASAALAVMRCMCVCLSVCPPRSCIVSKRIIISSKFFTFG